MLKVKRFKVERIEPSASNRALPLGRSRPAPGFETKVPMASILPQLCHAKRLAGGMF
jgi:hypothetical protein